MYINNGNILLFLYDKVSANGVSSDPKNYKFQSGHRVIKKVLNTKYYVYLGRKLACLWFATPDFLLHDRFLAYDLTLSRYNFETEAWSPKTNTFSESWVRKDSVYTSPE